MTRIPVKRASWLAPLLLLFGATASRSYMEVDWEKVTVRLGWYRVVVPREDVIGVTEDRWPWYGGLGWRADFRSRLALVAAYSPVVRLDLARPQRARLLGIPIRFDRLYVSVESPDLVRAALSR